MNQLIRARVGCIAVLLIVSMILCGCSPEVCGILCSPFLLDPGAGAIMWFLCFLRCTGAIRVENSDLCSATWEQMQLAAIEICEEYPEECQQAFDAYLESLEEEETE